MRIVVMSGVVLGNGCEFGLDELLAVLGGVRANLHEYTMYWEF